jgi:hypothetical protein
MFEKAPDSFHQKEALFDALCLLARLGFGPLRQ